MVKRVQFRTDPRHEFNKLADDVLLDFGEAASVLGLSPHALKSWRRDGRGPRAIKLGYAVRYSVGDLRAWLASYRKSA